LGISTIGAFGEKPIESSGCIKVLKAIEVVITHLVNNHTDNYLWGFGGLGLNTKYISKKKHEKSNVFHNSKLHNPFCLAQATF
jgi:hypothetical protein